MNSNVLFYNKHQIVFEFENGISMVNATQMALIFGKPVGNFLRLKQTKEFIKILQTRYSDSNIGLVQVIRVVKGGNKNLQGTWMEERLALKFAAWLSPEFELWVYDTIRNLYLSKNLIWHVQRITDNIDEVKRLLETIPGSSHQKLNVW